MARPPKPISLQTAKMSKEEREERNIEEEKLKGKSDKVYKVPRDLDKDVKKYYKWIVDVLKESDILINADIPTIINAAFALSELRKEQKKVTELGSVLKNSKGDYYKSPHLQAVKDLDGLYNGAGGKLGLSPTDRAKIALAAMQSKKEDDDDDDF